MKYLYILLLSIFFTDCVSIPKGYVANDNTCHYNDPIFKINKEELTLNQNILNQLKNKEGGLVLIDNENFESKYIRWKEDGFIINYQTNKQLNIGKWLYYYPNGKIKSSTFMYLNGVKAIGKETLYDKQGNIEKVINYEKGYNICWAEAIEIVKKIAKKDIEKYKITQFNLPFRVDLNKFPNEKPEWGVMLEKNENYEPKENKVYWIDGVTGKFLRTTKIFITHD